MSEFVLDASALLALLDGEPGQHEVERTLPGASMSAVNLAEAISKLAERGMPPDRAHAGAVAVGVRVVAFDEEQAAVAGALRPITRSAGLSLGDRCCLALARIRGAVALTTDRSWQGVAAAAGVSVRNVRAGVA